MDRPLAAVEIGDPARGDPGLPGEPGLIQVHKVAEEHHREARGGLLGG